VEVKYDSNGNKTYIFPYKLKFEISEAQGGIKVQHLAYFANAYIDINKIVTEEALFSDIDLPQTIVDKLSMGQISVQPVIQDGTTNNFSQVFYQNPTNSQGDPINFPDLLDSNDNIIGKDYSEASIWTGPVHYHGAGNPGPNGYTGYMAGAPGEDMGPFLTLVAVGNNIIQDYREVREIEKINFDYSYFSNSWFNQTTTEKLQNNIDGLKQLAGRDNPYLNDTQDIEIAVIKSLTSSKNESVFGDMYIATDGSGNKRFAFSFDMRQAVKQNTVFPKLVDYLLNRVSVVVAKQNAEDLLNQKLIKDLKIYRHRVYDENVADPVIDNHEPILNEDAKLVVQTSEDNNGQLLPKAQIARASANQKALPATVGTIKTNRHRHSS
jgi:hypothetical protein